MGVPPGVPVAVGVAVVVAVVVGVPVGVRLLVAVGVAVEPAVAVAVGVPVTVAVAVGVGVKTDVAVGVAVRVVVAVAVAVAVGVPVAVGVAVEPGVAVAVAVRVVVAVAVAVGVRVAVGVAVAVAVTVAVGVAVAVVVAVRVAVAVGVAVPVGVAVGVRVTVAVGVSLSACVCAVAVAVGWTPANGGVLAAGVARASPARRNDLRHAGRLRSHFCEGVRKAANATTPSLTCVRTRDCVQLPEGRAGASSAGSLHSGGHRARSEGVRLPVSRKPAGRLLTSRPCAPTSRALASPTPPAGDRPWLRGALVVVLLLAAGARFADLDWDDGHSFHPDERAIVFAVQRMSFVPLQLDPGFFAYGSFPLYLIRGVTSAAGWFQPAWRNDFASVVLAGRALSALAGVLTVWALFRLGARLFGRPVGLLAAALLAACPLHIQCSHFLASDVALTLLALLAIDACVALGQHGRPRDALLAGAWIGLALATKVSAAPLLAPLALALVLRRGGALRPAALSVGALVAAALAGQPYAVFSFTEFWRQVTEQGAMVRNAGSLPYTIQYVGVPKYAYDLWQMAVWGMGPALGAAALWGSGVALWRLRAVRSAPALVLASWVVPFVLLTGAFDVKYPRYLLPVYPILILWAAAWLWDARASRVGRAFLFAVPAATAAVCSRVPRGLSWPAHVGGRFRMGLPERARGGHAPHAALGRRLPAASAWP